MADICDVCGERTHYKKVNGKNYYTVCPFEKFKKVKSFYSEEFKNVFGRLFFDDESMPLGNDPESLKSFQKLIPEETPIQKYIKKLSYKRGSSVKTKTLIIQSSQESFFKHFNKVLIDIYDSNDILFVDSVKEPMDGQFSYLWLSPTTLRECYFRDSKSHARFKNMSELGIPSLVLYPIGNVQSVTHSAWGDILLDLITHRQCLGKPTWIINSKGLVSCPEVQSSKALKEFLLYSDTIPTIPLDSEIDEEVFNSGTEIKRKTKTSSYGV